MYNINEKNLVKDVLWKYYFKVAAYSALIKYSKTQCNSLNNLSITNGMYYNDKNFI